MQSWENDPNPTVIMMYALEGAHPNTGHQFRFFQGINFSYVPRAIRRRFIEDWIKILEKTNNPRFTWEQVKSRYPGIQHAVRRYFFKPSYYITKLEEVPFDKIEKVVVSTWSKDFSKRVRTSLINKFRNVLKNRQKIQKGQRPKRSMK